MDNTTRVFRCAGAKLPPDVAALISNRIRWLRSELPRLDEELGLKYPDVEVVPIGWFLTLESGQRGHVPGRVIPSARDDHYRYVVQLTGAALLAYPDDLLMGVLAHEYLHVVHHTLKQYEFTERNAPGSAFRMDAPDYTANIETYRRRDVQDQADENQWLTPRLRNLAALADSDNPLAREAWDRVQTMWVERKLPCEEPNLRFRTDTVVTVLLDEMIIARAKALMDSTQQ